MPYIQSSLSHLDPLHLCSCCAVGPSQQPSKCRIIELTTHHTFTLLVDPLVGCMCKKPASRCHKVWKSDGCQLMVSTSSQAFCLVSSTQSTCTGVLMHQHCGAFKSCTHCPCLATRSSRQCNCSCCTTAGYGCMYGPTVAMLLICV